MSAFDILDPATDIHQNLILEASAGCGKTFAIEHLVARLVNEGTPLSQIVIVTFTKKGAADLKERIFAKLKQTCQANRIDLDEAHITTIHAFVLKLLQEDPLGSGALFETLATTEILNRLVVDFLKTASDFMTLEELNELVLSYPLPQIQKGLIARDLEGYEELQKRFVSFLSAAKAKEDLFEYDDILSAFQSCLERPEVLKGYQKRFRVGIIDEFQDTDPLQWEIFSRLFLHDQGRLYLVGDPKQSIYSFRKGDIYTYLEAQRRLGPGALRELSVNFRSDPSLIDGLNRLFARVEGPSFLPLPKLNRHLPVPLVAAPPGKEDRPPLLFKNQPWDKIQFFHSERGDEAFFNFIAARIPELAAQGVPLREIAILADTNRLADELHEYLKKLKIPSRVQRESGEEMNEAVQGFKKVINAAENPRSDSSLITALSTPFFGWNPPDKDRLDDLIFKEQVVWLFMQLKEKLELGVQPFLGALLASAWEKGTVKEKLLSHPDGEAWLEELEAHAAKAVSRQEDFEETPPVSTCEAVQILTLHVSKGLEFEVVFTLGLAERRMKKKTKSTDPQKEAEEQAEKLRLLYVALTRAKRQLFVPLNFKKRAANIQTPPIELFLSQCFKKVDVETLRSNGLSVVEASGLEPVLSLEKRVPGELIAPPSFSCDMPLKELLSFTKIKGHGSKTTPAIEWDVSDLPPGPETGVMFHELLEKIPLSMAQEAQTPADYFDFAAAFVKGTAWEMWQDLIAERLHALFNSSLPGESFLLKEVEEARSFREVEFFHSDPRGYMRGVIDWLFEKEGRYYIVDWKTNWLKDYSEPLLHETLIQEGYHLQAAIYKEAALKFLSRCDPGASFQGTYFYFIRGGKICRAN